MMLDRLSKELAPILVRAAPRPDAESISVPRSHAKNRNQGGTIGRAQLPGVTTRSRWMKSRTLPPPAWVVCTKASRMSTERLRPSTTIS